MWARTRFRNGSSHLQARTADVLFAGGTASGEPLVGFKELHPKFGKLTLKNYFFRVCASRTSATLAGAILNFHLSDLIGIAAYGLSIDDGSSS